ncbi:conjugal transfer protein TraH [Acidithiobacillus sp. M4-SHS-6]|uniref:conjugal transfer protein TraH n=1 Tax=Acidithiobacillus sp. M4-SHS-6 TaxID=3383024 RepID=UPI0039BDE756
MRLFKPIALFFLLASLVMMPVTEAFAGMNPFKDLTAGLTEAGSGPAVYNSPGHTTFYGGNLSVHVPSDTVQLISISPPSFSAGCAGINMYFGGFSFISGANFGKLIQAIMQAAPGYVINLAIRTLCPECSDILTELQKLAQAANGMGMNACDDAKSLVNGLGGLLGVSLPGGKTKGSPSGQSTISNAAKKKAGTGASSGFFSAFNSYAGDAASALKGVANFLNNPGELFGSGSGTKNEAAAKESKYVGNQEWMALTEDGYSNTYVKEIIMALAGFRISGGKADPKVAQDAHLPVAPNPEDVVKVLEYGAHPNQCFAALKTDVANESGKVNTEEGLATIAEDEQAEAQSKYTQGVKVPTCFLENSTQGVTPEETAMGTAGVLEDCNHVNISPVSALQSSADISLGQTRKGLVVGYNPYLNGNGDGCGILGSVALSLTHAVARVTNEEPLTATEDEYIQMAPFPLYQLINDAAVYPSAAGQMVDTYAPLLSYLISRDVVLQWLASAHDINTTMTRKLNPKAMAQIGAIAKELYNEINQSDKQLAVGMTVQEGIMAQIDEMNKMIAGQAAMAGMAGNMMFTRSVTADATE